MDTIDVTVRKYVEEQIIPRYAAFDKAHRADHVNMVIEQSMKLAAMMPGVGKEMAYVTAAFHDLGLVNGRENHHIDSRKILEEDEFVRSRYTPEQIRLMGEAVEDHRASKSGKPRNDYGLIVAEADRLIDMDTILRRTVQYGFAHYPEMSREEQIARAIAHLHEKYAEGGYLKLWIPESPNAGRLRELWALIRREDELLLRVENIYDEIKI